MSNFHLDLPAYREKAACGHSLIHLYPVSQARQLVFFMLPAFGAPLSSFGGLGPVSFSVSSWELENYLEPEFLCLSGPSCSQTYLALATVLMYSWEYIGEQDIHRSPSQGVYIVVLPVAMAYLPVKMSCRQNKRKLRHQDGC